MASPEKIQELKDIANKLRIHSVVQTTAANSGHPTSCASAAEVMSVLFFHVMKYTGDFPRHPSSDRFILSKGHAAPVLYAAWAEAGVIPVDELKNLRKIDSELEGHPTPRQSYIDVATGSLGQGLGVSCGMAYCGKYIDKASYRVYCLMGDGESAEGSVWEAFAFASYYKLDNLVAIIDVNRLGQSEAASLGHDLETYRKRADAFGFNAIIVDGHDVEKLIEAFETAAATKDKPTALILKTFKGKGFPNVEDLDNWHGKPLGPQADAALEAVRALIKNNGPHGIKPLAFVDDAPKVDLSAVKLSEPPNYKLGDKHATRKIYGDALVKLGKSCSRVIALDGDTKNSTFSLTYKKAFNDRYVECFIAEQNLVGVGTGLACRDRNIVFCSTFACFLSRAFDQIRMGAISQTNCNFVGSHAGVSIGEDGPSQMALEDFAMFRSVATSICFYPSDAVSTERAIELAARSKGITFTRTTRPATPVIYSNDEKFEVGKGKLVRSSDKDQVTVVGAGVTLFEALSAYDTLKKEDITIRVIDPFTLKPIDTQLLIDSAAATGGRVVTVEDHYPEGGLGEAVCGALTSVKSSVVVRRLAIPEVARSGPGSVLMDKYGISARAIVEAVKDLLK
ncbi:PREDICTED: transketolase-like protein 2 [Amphimedon queenslandica]|nr:PREDICTED: transketolase-like protein 2 [Amphimedon queenslandica]|eukprot:XP_003383991.1 PREDICTED: transketolase-like protein 2 [Amphimedon queenslandica]